jgi:hypothetical protein
MYYNILVNTSSVFSFSNVSGSFRILFSLSHIFILAAEILNLFLSYWSLSKLQKKYISQNNTAFTSRYKIVIPARKVVCIFCTKILYEFLVSSMHVIRCFSYYVSLI